MHFFCADLYLEAGAFLGDHRGVQRLVQVRTRHGDEIFNAPRHRAPQVVHNAEDGVAILHRTCDHAHGVEVINLVHGDALLQQFLVNAEQPLDAAFDIRRDSGLFQLGT